MRKFTRYFRSGKGYVLRCAVEDCALIVGIAVVAKIAEIVLKSMMEPSETMSHAFVVAHEVAILLLLFTLILLLVKDLLLHLQRNVWALFKTTRSGGRAGPPNTPPTLPRPYVLLYRSLAIVVIGVMALALALFLTYSGVDEVFSRAIPGVMAAALLAVLIAREASALLKRWPEQVARYRVENLFDFAGINDDALLQPSEHVDLEWIPRHDRSEEFYHSARVDNSKQDKIAS